MVGFFHFAQRGRDVGIGQEGDGNVLAVGAFDFFVGLLLGSIIGYRCRQDGGIHLWEGGYGCFVHFVGRFHFYEADAGMSNRKGGGTGDERNVGSAGCAFFGKGVAHFPGREITDEADGVDAFVGGAGSYEDFFSAQRVALRKEIFEEDDNVFGFFHAPFAFEMTGQFAFGRFDDVCAIGFQLLEVALRDGMPIHIEIHGRCNKDRGFHGKVSGDEYVVGNAVGHFPDGGGGGGSHQHGVGPKAEVDVTVPCAVGRSKKFADHRLPG